MPAATHEPPPRFSAKVLFGLLGAALLIRLPVLFDSVVDWDESLYLLISDDLLDGVLPYGQTWDHKPPVIFYVFAAAQLMFGGGVTAVRILGVVGAGLGAYGIHQLLQLLWPRSKGAVTGALAYLLLFAAIGGLATNTEVIFAAFVIGGTYAVLVGSASSERAVLWWVLGGMAFGVGFGVKYVVGFDLLGFAALHLAFVWGHSGRGFGGALGATLYAGAVVLASFVATLALQLLPFLLSGRLDDVIAYTITYNAQYTSTHIYSGALLQGFNAMLALSGAWIGALMLLFWPDGGLRDDARSSRIGGALFVWLLFDMVSVLVQGRLFPHHCLQLVPVLALLFGVFAGAVQERIAGHRRVAGAVTAAVLLVVLTLMGPVQELGWRGLRLLRNAVAGDLHRDDLPQRIAARIRSELEPGDAIYVFNDHPVIYHLAGARVPTRFPFPLHLQNQSVAQGVGFDADAEIARILAERPRFIVVREDESVVGWRGYALLEHTLAESYDRVACYPLYARGRTRPVDVVFRMEVSAGQLSLYARRDGEAGLRERPCAER